MILNQNTSLATLREIEESCEYIMKYNTDDIIFTLGCFMVPLTIITFFLRRRILPHLNTPPTILYYMAKTSFQPDHREFCKTLTEKEKYDVNCIDQDEKLSLFLCSCLSGNAELVSFMLNRGANIESVSQYGDSALYLAAYGFLKLNIPDFRILNILVAAGCDVNHQNSGGFTVLHLAALKGRLDLVRLFVLHGADPSIPNNEGMLPLDIALVEGFRDIAEFLMKRKQRKSKSQSVYF